MTQVFKSSGKLERDRLLEALTIEEGSKYKLKFKFKLKFKLKTIQLEVNSNLTLL